MESITFKNGDYAVTYNAFDGIDKSECIITLKTHTLIPEIKTRDCMKIFTSHVFSNYNVSKFENIEFEDGIYILEHLDYSTGSNGIEYRYKFKQTEYTDESYNW